MRSVVRTSQKRSNLSIVTLVTINLLAITACVILIALVSNATCKDMVSTSTSDSCWPAAPSSSMRMSLTKNLCLNSDAIGICKQGGCDITSTGGFSKFRNKFGDRRSCRMYWGESNLLKHGDLNLDPEDAAKIYHTTIVFVDVQTKEFITTLEFRDANFERDLIKIMYVGEEPKCECYVLFMDDASQWQRPDRLSFIKEVDVDFVTSTLFTEATSFAKRYTCYQLFSNRTDPTKPIEAVTCGTFAGAMLKCVRPFSPPMSQFRITAVQVFSDGVELLESPIDLSSPDTDPDAAAFVRFSDSLRKSTSNARYRNPSYGRFVALFDPSVSLRSIYIWVVMAGDDSYRLAKLHGNLSLRLSYVSP